MPVIILGEFIPEFHSTKPPVLQLSWFFGGVFILQRARPEAIKKMLIDSAIMTSVCMIIMGMPPLRLGYYR